ncbi:MAG: elongation factor P maturation arginine rhamnosyltransferase EarP, partial [Burkholderiales bacterium]|nr:elongation factor P maturation arginine rhamnosyltransferase EarP [Burkholderiales bacterium]
LGWPAHGAGNLRLHPLPPLTQTDYDHLLWACNLNFVRGEDSLVRALWARKPFVWHIYPQDDGAHVAKLNAFLDWAHAPDEVRDFHAMWNAAPASSPAKALPRKSSASPDTPCPVQACTEPECLPDWIRAERWAQQLADRLWAQPDLVTQLLAALPDHPKPTSPQCEGEQAFGTCTAAQAKMRG